MNLESMKYFVTTVNNGSINKAARELNLTQPALSTAISKMEDELGIVLLKRFYNGVVPTEVGEIVYREAEQILETVQDWYQLKNTANDIIDFCNVHILAVPTACAYLANTLVENIRSHNPNICVLLHECQHKLMMRQLAESKMNIGILSLSSFDLTFYKDHVIHQGWRMEVLYEEERELFLSITNPLVKKDYLTIADLQKLTYACYSRNSDAITEQYKIYFNREYCYMLNNYYSILEMVAKDKAVTIFPPKILQENIFIKKGMLTSKPIQGIATRVVYVLVCPSDEMILTKCEKKVIKLVKDEFYKMQNN